MLYALTRPTGPELARCELTHLTRSPIDLSRAAAQHRDYLQALRDLEVVVHELPRLPDHPDAVFIEDTALVLDEVAVLLRPGIQSRRGEVSTVEEALAPYRPLLRLEGPGTVDGGDLVVLDKLILVGQTSRTDHAGLKALAHLLLPHGYIIKACDPQGVLHLKSACTALDDETLLAHRPSVDLHRVPGVRVVATPEDEPQGANVLRVGGTVLVSAQAPRTASLVEGLGHLVRLVDVSEFNKAEAALTCKSLLFKV